MPKEGLAKQIQDARDIADSVLRGTLGFQHTVGKQTLMAVLHMQNVHDAGASKAACHQVSAYLQPSNPDTPAFTTLNAVRLSSVLRTSRAPSHFKTLVLVLYLPGTFHPQIFTGVAPSHQSAPSSKGTP